MLIPARGKHSKVRMPFTRRKQPNARPPTTQANLASRPENEDNQAEKYKTTIGRPRTPHPRPSSSRNTSSQAEDHITSPAPRTSYPNAPADSVIDDKEREKYQNKALPPTPELDSSFSSRFDKKAKTQQADHFHRVFHTFDSSLRNTKRLEHALLYLREDHVTTIYPHMANQLEFTLLLTDKLSANFHFLRSEYEALEASMKERMDEYVFISDRMEGLMRENKALRRHVGDWDECLREQNWRVQYSVESGERQMEREGVCDYEKPRGVGLIGWDGFQLRVQHKWRRKNRYVWERRESVSDDRELKGKESIVMDCRVTVSNAKRLGHDCTVAVVHGVKKRKQRASTWWANKVYWYERGKAVF